MIHDINWKLLTWAIGLAGILTLAQVLLRWSVARYGQESIYLLLARGWLPIGIALALFGLTFFGYLIALRILPISSLYPIYTALSLALVFAAGIVFFNESISAAKAVGVVLIVLGVILVSGRP
jgi:small multidrug resistance pump